MISIYIWCELVVWLFMTYSAIYYGKMFDHEYVKTEEFVSHIEGNKGGNWYYLLMFGNLNLLKVDADQQHNVQGEMEFSNKLKLNFLHNFSEMRCIEHAVCFCFWRLFHLDNFLFVRNVGGEF